MARKKNIQVPPVIQKIRDDKNKDIRSFGELEGRYVKKKSHSLHSFNLIELLHIKNKAMYENAHTRILGALLDYNKNQFLQSFTDRFCDGLSNKFRKNGNHVEIERQYRKEKDKWGAEDDNTEINDTNKTINSDRRRIEESASLCRPDCLVWNDDKYAIIIENKINGAKPTPHQVDNYIEAVLDDENIFVPNEENRKSVWVVYLGGDTAEMPPEQSLSIKSEKKDKYFIIKKDESRSPGKHLSIISYKDDIIPWLEEDVLPMCPIGMRGLTGGLMAYIDYLKNMFEDSLSEELMFYDSKDVLESFNKIEKSLLPFFWEKYNNITDYVNNDVFAGQKDITFFKALRHYFLKHHFRFTESNDEWMIRTTGSLVHMWKKSWERIQVKPHATCDLFFELFPYQIDNYLSDPSYVLKHTITCSLRYKGKDSRWEESLKNHGVSLDGYIFDKKGQKNAQGLILKNNQGFFESFIEDPTIQDICGRIDTALNDYIY
jgi:hypothetical protein